jgi:hypothetical protein
MAHRQDEFGYYVQAEPDLEAAWRVLNWDPEDTADRAAVEPEEAPQAGRAILGTDDRNATTCPGCTPSSWVGLSQAGGSGTLIGWTTIYTAAHMLYDNSPVAVDNTGVGWLCANATPDTNVGGAPPNDNPCDGIGDPGDPRWRFFNGLVTCPQAAQVNNAWLAGNLNSNQWTRARHDYGVVELNCSPGLGHMGSIILSGGGPLDTFTGVVGGYPGRFPCPAGSRGTAADCPAGAFQWVGMAAPWTSATLYWTPQSFFFGGTEQASHTWIVYADTTTGMSGGPLRHGANRIVGVEANSTGGASPQNRFNRLTSTVWTFIQANSSL